MPSQLYNIPKEKMQELFDTSNSMADVLRKVGFSPYGGDHPTLHRYIKKFGIDTTKLQQNRKNSKRSSSKKSQKTSLEDILSGNVSYSSSDRLKKRLIAQGYKQHKCEMCGKTEWLGFQIPIQLDHIDGDHSNNRLDNLRILCPNCHALTQNYCGRNTEKAKENKIKRDKLEQHAEERKAKDLDCHNRTYEERTKSPGKNILKKEIRTASFRSLGRKYGVSDNTVRKWCIHYGLPTLYHDIKNMSDEQWENL